MLDGHGFSIDYSDEMKTIELIFTPDGGENILLSTENSEYGWDADGTPILNNINSVHVNAIDVTLDTNISDHFLPGYPYHVVISLGDNPGSNLKFNQNQDDTISGGANMYSNIAIYADQLTDEEIHDHYLLITDRYSTSVSDTSISLSELDSGQDSTSFYIVEFEPSGTNI
jgi:hypothetical protein